MTELSMWWWGVNGKRFLLKRTILVGTLLIPMSLVVAQDPEPETIVAPPVSGMVASSEEPVIPGVVVVPETGTEGTPEITGTTGPGTPESSASPESPEVQGCSATSGNPENPESSENQIPGDGTENSEMEERRRKWLRDWNDYWLDHEPSVTESEEKTESSPDQAMFEEMAAAVAAQNDPDAIHRKIYAHPLDDPENQRYILFCAVCTILIVTGIRLIIRRRSQLKRLRSAPLTKSDAKTGGPGHRGKRKG
ncbi:MAG: hypothetical protein Q4C47_09110, partial [Planctomycetia bacterium]|nr:hypothetical protein [Planctomycetia bacterium]